MDGVGNGDDAAAVARQAQSRADMEAEHVAVRQNLCLIFVLVRYLGAVGLCVTHVVTIVVC